MKFRRPTVENRGWAWWIACSIGLSLLAGAIAYWASIWFAPAVRIAPAGSLSDQSGPVNLSQAEGLFGQMPSNTPAPVAAAAPSNFKVLGIVAAGVKGSAILSIDGKPAKVYAVGDKFEGDNLVLAVDARQVTIGSAPKGHSAATNRQFLPVPLKPDISLLTQGPAKTAANGAAGASSGLSPNGLPQTAGPQIGGFGANAPITPPPASIIAPPPAISPPPPASGMSPGTPLSGLPPTNTWASPTPNTGVNPPSPQVSQ